MTKIANRSDSLANDNRGFSIIKAKSSSPRNNVAAFYYLQARTMAIRTLTLLEQRCVDLITAGERTTGWEYAAYLESKDGPLIELLTRRNTFGADPPQDLIDMAQKGTRFVVHHNHPSQGSLSLADWNGAATLNFEEIFAYSGDGTIYWGRGIDCAKLREFYSQNPIDQLAERLLCDDLVQAQRFDALPDVPSRFACEVANRAMKIKNYVDYEVRWGSTNVPLAPNMVHTSGGAPAHVLAQKFEHFFDSAAMRLATMI
ncbi:hypothetical protein EGT07_07840 [Herbaspirillum sp. HC18]|nr:hypothetical protein EGT07_07840 [Herbaspirillum sp. HC18]